MHEEVDRTMLKGVILLQDNRSMLPFDDKEHDPKPVNFKDSCFKGNWSFI